jgi:hypothetical protein
MTDEAHSAPPLVELLWNGNWPDETEARELVDELYYQRAIHAYMTMLPALNVIGLRDGSQAAFGAGYHVLPIWKDRMDARAWVPTPNADVIYAMSYLDLAETGPLVVAAPPQVIGMFTDFFQRTITDVARSGPTAPVAASTSSCPRATGVTSRPATSRSRRRPTTCSCSSAPS